MSYTRVKGNAVNAGEPVDTALLQDIANANRYIQQRKKRRATHFFDQSNPPRMCGLRPVILPSIWSLTPGCEHLRVHVDHKVGNQPVEMSVSVRPLRDLSQTLYEFSGSLNQTTINPGNRTKTTFDLDQFSIQSMEGEVVLFIILKSHIGPWQVMTTATHPENEGFDLLSSLLQDEIFFAELNAGGITNGIPHKAIRIAEFWENKYNQQWEEDNRTKFLPHTAQVLRKWNFRAPMFPPARGFKSNMNSLDVPSRYQASQADLGYSELYAIEVEEVSLRPLPDYGAIYNARAPLLAHETRLLYNETATLFGKHTKVIHYGPTTGHHGEDKAVDRAKDDSYPSTQWWGTSGGGYVLANPVSRILSVRGKHTYLGATGQNGSSANLREPGWADPLEWGELASTAVSPGDRYLWNGEERQRSAYEAFALVCMTDTSEPGREFEVRFRLHMEDAGPPGSNVHTSSDGEIQISTIKTHSSFGEDTNPGDDVPGYLLSLYDDNGEDHFTKPRLHSMSGFYDLASWSSYQWVVVRIRTIDQHPSSGLRRLSLQAVVSDTPIAGGRESRAEKERLLHVGAFTVIEVPSLDGDEIGVTV